ncbi:MAG: hydantoinase/oxoprolinase family protein, partial [Phycisphaeraceae bacterium]
MNHPPSIRIGVDTGGTFTDLVLVDENHRLLASHKLLSTPDDPARAVLEGIDLLLDKTSHPPRQNHPPHVVHGSTVATNALLEGKRSGTCFITTAGFEDTLAIARQDRPALYALTPSRPAPPVSADRCLGANQRIAPDGRVIRPLDEAEIQRLVARVGQLGADAVAISLLHSYASGEHEQRLAQALRSAFGNRLHLTVSHHLLPEHREYERAATAAVNAAVAPRMVRYLDRLAGEIGETHLRIMASHGGTLPLSAVRQAPVRTVLSGPAGGVLGAAEMARLENIHRIVTLDMGGTSTDVALCAGEPKLTTEGEAGNLPVRLPMIDMHTVGAGGGSIAWLDPGGALRVGPHSAGAEPGPACYGKQTGHLQATVTDAHVLLGHIPADEPLGEGLMLDRDAAQQAVSNLARRAGLDLEQTAEGILRIAETTMARAVHRISLQRGRDPRECTLVPFGGAGGLHACRLADALGMTRVLVPAQPGLLSAVGMLGAAPRYTFSHALQVTLHPQTARYPDPATQPAVRHALAALREQARAALAAERLPEPDRRERARLDLRYQGQSYEITVPLEDGQAIPQFLAEHQRLYGYTAAEKPIEVVAVRLEAGGHPRRVAPPRLTMAATAVAHVR